MRPWNQPTTLPSASAARDALDESASSLERSNRAPARSERLDRVRRAELPGRVAAVHRVASAAARRAACPEQVVRQRAPRRARRPRRPPPAESRFVEHPRAGAGRCHAVERDAAGQAQILARRSSRATAAPFEHDLFGDPWIDRARSISRCVRSAFRAARGGPPNSSSKARSSSSGRCSSRSTPGSSGTSRRP